MKARAISWNKQKAGRNDKCSWVQAPLEPFVEPHVILNSFQDVGFKFFLQDSLGETSSEWHYYFSFAKVTISVSEYFVKATIKAFAPLVLRSLCQLASDINQRPSLIPSAATFSSQLLKQSRGELPAYFPGFVIS